MYSGCCVGLCVYNNEFGLPYVLKNIKKLESIFNKVTIIAYYDKSIDRSLDILENNDFKFKENVIILQGDNNSNVRTERIAFARNKILNWIRQYHSYSEFFMMMDSNEYACIGDINLDTIHEVMEKRELWDAVSFDREAGYYDTWALSFDPYIYSFFHFYNWNGVVGQMRAYFNKMFHECKQNDPNGLIPVYSAFNGCCIYKTKLFLNCTYSSRIDISLFPTDILKKQAEITGEKRNDSLYNDCEHRHFHLEAIKKNNVRIRIYPKSLFAKFKGELPKNCRGPA